MNKKKMIIVACAALCGFAAMATIEPQVDEQGNMTFTVAEGAAETYADAIAGDGITVVKKGTGALTLTGENTFTGELRIEEGTLTAAPTAHSGKPKLVVLNGATFESAGGGGNGWFPDGVLPFESISIEGAGVNGNGAFVRSSGTSMRTAEQPPMTLTGDATVNFTISHNPGAVSLNGYTLTKIGAGNWDGYNNGVVSANLDRDGSYGKIVIKEGKLQLQYQAITLGSDKNVLTFMAGTAFNMYPVSWGPKCPWTVKVEGDATFTSLTDTTSNRALVCLSGPVEITGGLLTLAHSKPNATWNFEGPVTAADGGGIKAVSGITRFHGDVDLGTGTYAVAKPGNARVEFLGNFKQSATAAQTFQPNFGATSFSGAEEVSISGPIGHQYDKYDQGTTGRVEVVDVEWFHHPNATYLSGSLALPQMLYITNSVWSGASTIYAGNNYSVGIVEMADSIVTNHFRAGGASGDNYQGTRGAVYQKGGVFRAPTSTVTLGASFGTGHGFYLNDGGIFSVENEVYLGGYGYGAMYFNGGKSSFSQKITLARNYSAAKTAGAGVYWQMGGATNSLSTVAMGGDPVTNGYALVAIEGTGTRCDLAGNTLYHVARCPFTGILAVNAGAVFRAKEVRRYNKTATPVTGADFLISVDGGVLQPSSTAAWSSGVSLPDAVTVHEGGMTLNTEASGSFTWTMPLTSPTGKIVRAVALPTDAAFEAEHQGLYIAPPLVRIHGTGKGAAAVALFDKNTRRVTGIKVVAPGTGYDENTTATISTAAGNRIAPLSCAVTLADAPETGAGFTKTGLGSYSFDVANTYHGPTAVEEGSLIVNNAAGLPEGSSLRVAEEATIDLKNHNITVPELSGAGTVKVGGSLTVAEKLRLPTKKGECLAVDGPITLADGAEIVFDGDVADLDTETVNRLFTATSLTCAGSVTLSELPAFWKMNVGNKGITVRRITGTTIVFR